MLLKGNTFTCFLFCSYTYSLQDFSFSVIFLLLVFIVIVSLYSHCVIVLIYDISLIPLLEIIILLLTCDIISNIIKPYKVYLQKRTLC